MSRLGLRGALTLTHPLAFLACTGLSLPVPVKLQSTCRFKYLLIASSIPQQTAPNLLYKPKDISVDSENLIVHTCRVQSVELLYVKHVVCVIYHEILTVYSFIGDRYKIFA